MPSAPAPRRGVLDPGPPGHRASADPSHRRLHRRPDHLDAVQTTLQTKRGQQGVTPTRPATSPPHPDPPHRPRPHIAGITRRERHPSPACRAAGTRNHHLLAGRRVHLDRQLASPYDGHGREPPFGPLPGAPTHRGRGPLRRPGHRSSLRSRRLALDPRHTGESTVLTKCCNARGRKCSPADGFPARRPLAGRIVRFATSGPHRLDKEVDAPCRS